GPPHYRGGRIAHDIGAPFTEARKLWDEMDAHWPGFYDRREDECEVWLARYEFVPTAGEAAVALEEARAILEQLTREQCNRRPLPLSVAQCDLLLADAYREARRPEAAAAALKRAHAMLEPFIPTEPRFYFNGTGDFIECLVRLGEL